ncbi:MAG: glycosyltransferase family 39 protein [Acidiferrobacterales bacterium]|nr:glycosyltransferase family 39 protein [Acidiferrobacterales bacterium]
MYQLLRDRPFIILCIICVNIALSWWCINADPIINNDAVTYLAIAQKLVDGVWNEAFTYYSWPFYSFFIAAFANILSVEVLTAAYILNTVFAILISIAFVCIAQDLSDSNRAIIIIATLLILFFPSINKYRSFIIRDFGYLACYLWSIYFIARFSISLNKGYFLGWFICTALSCLFRFEGVIFLLIVPYFILIYAARRIPNKRTILVFLAVAIAIVFISLTVWYLNDKYLGLIKDAKSSGHNVNGLKDLFFASVNSNLNGESLTVSSYLLLLVNNIGDVIYQLLRRTSVINFVLAIYAYKYRLVLKKLLLKRIWLIYVALNVIILTSFSFYNHFIVSRYTLATSLTLLILVPFAIYRLMLWAREKNRFTMFFALLIILLLAIEALDKLNIENKKYHVKNAGQWLSTQLNSDEKVYSNNKLIIYYANRDADTNLSDLYSLDMLLENLDMDRLKYYDYVAYSTISSYQVDFSVADRLTKEYGELMTIIPGHGEQSVLIYQRQ